MKERGIPYVAPMVRAVIAGTKTQTRRVVKPQPQPNGGEGLSPLRPYRNPHGLWAWVLEETGHGSGGNLFACPYGQPGDRLWVREAWRADKRFDHLPPRDIPAGSAVMYEADGGECRFPLMTPGRLRPGMFMPRWASRILLEVVAVRVERLQDINEDDAAAEGIRYADGSYELEWMTPAERGRKRVDDYRVLWDSINAKRHPWASNPWVWVVEFKKVAP